VLFLAVLFLPALCSGWIYSQVHNEVEDLTPLKVALLWSFNLAGSLAGGIITGYLFPTYSYMIYSGIFLVLLLAVAFFVVYKDRKGKIISISVAAAYCLVLLALNGPVYKRFYKTVYNMLPEVRQKDLPEFSQLHLFDVK